MRYGRNHMSTKNAQGEQYLLGLSHLRRCFGIKKEEKMIVKETQRRRSPLQGVGIGVEIVNRSVQCRFRA